MYNYKLTIQYDGTRYKGWQRLGKGEQTIQAKLEKALSQMAGESIEIIGASRTDAGVHALGQIANFKIEQKLEETKVYKFLNHYLPPDISILDVEQVHESFHARFHAKEKVYLYKIWNETYSHPFMRKYSMHVQKKLDMVKMQTAARYFIGKHDFTAYSNAKSNKKKTVREIYSIDMEEKEGFLFIRVRGNGFLYNMVRKMVGTWIEVGLHEKTAEEIPEIIRSKERSRTGRMAEACGLYLEQIHY